MTNIVAFKTDKIYELEMVKDALKEAGIPFFIREDTMVGLHLPIPIAPVPVPGVSFLVLVPEIAFEESRALIKTLPVEETEADPVRRFNPPKEGKQLFKMEGRHYAVIIFLIFVFFISRLFSH
ncbi:MAG: DUF2007 domain-containing protein [Deltaproteobacteria bacterium]|nr:DUF2007 domain-containing protein [Deltaproteobacteria bacterium]